MSATVVLPTYNEANNVGKMVDALLALPVSGLHALVGTITRPMARARWQRNSP